MIVLSVFLTSFVQLCVYLCVWYPGDTFTRFFYSDISLGMKDLCAWYSGDTSCWYFHQLIVRISIYALIHVIRSIVMIIKERELNKINEEGYFSLSRTYLRLWHFTRLLRVHHQCNKNNSKGSIEKGILSCKAQSGSNRKEDPLASCRFLHVGTHIFPTLSPHACPTLILLIY